MWLELTGGGGEAEEHVAAKIIRVRQSECLCGSHIFIDLHFGFDLKTIERH